MKSRHMVVCCVAQEASVPQKLFEEQFSNFMHLLLCSPLE